ncbi:MAG: aspartate aminotransferase family protein [Acidocella sp. 20-57-95]|nr:MAG: aspartate aminotransferase family protein [Acidocella sp. 20-57-95]OYV60791.1 MAG: aspartate aminotransferase family protein [Acidocella sp. 21-58-7]HQT64908.1 aspartate aminotransferase family protein [Acidocella sp.]HQU03836.1 aspartate aminotransferase family protein [Acidocella sp.]
MLDDINGSIDWQGLDAAHHLHPFTDHKSLHEGKVRVITDAEGVYLHDAEGNKILDGMAGLWCVAAGYSRPELVQAATRQMQKLPYYNTFFKTTTPPVVALAQRLAQITPAGLNHAFFACSGSEAVDTALRMARVYWQTLGKPSKKIIIGREYGYHGSTTLGASAGGMVDMHRQGGDMPNFVQVMPPYWYGYGGQMSPAEFGIYAARQVEDKIRELGADHVAAFIGEPLQGAGGVIIPPETYWPEINRICQENNILLIADEVICGFGRTGQMFGSDYFGIKPDMMTMAKAITSGYLPLSAVMLHDRVADVLINETGEFYHGFTYSGHPVACAVALANLDIIQNEGLVQRADAMGVILREKLHAALDHHPMVGEIRGVGLIGAIELTADKRTRKFFEKRGRVGMICRDYCVANGLVMRAVRDSMVYSPPLTITEAELDVLVARAAQSIEQTYAQVKNEVAL